MTNIWVKKYESKTENTGRPEVKFPQWNCPGEKEERRNIFLLSDNSERLRASFRRMRLRLILTCYVIRITPLNESMSNYKL